MIVRASLLAVCLAAAAAQAAGAQTVRVPADHADIVRLPGNAASVIVGNPAIADATLHDSRTLLVTGRVYGQTNLIALDRAGRVIYAADLAVTASARNEVRVFRNTLQSSFACNPVCQAVPAIGDDDESFGRITSQRSTLTGEAESASESADLEGGGGRR